MLKSPSKRSGAMVFGDTNSISKVKVLASKSDDLSVIPRAHTVGEATPGSYPLALWTSFLIKNL